MPSFQYQHVVCLEGTAIFEDTCSRSRKQQSVRKVNVVEMAAFFKFLR